MLLSPSTASLQPAVRSAILFQEQGKVSVVQAKAGHLFQEATAPQAATREVPDIELRETDEQLAEGQRKANERY